MSGTQATQAQRQVERFIRRFEPSYLQLAYYAALPLVLTPELLHYLRNQFLRHVSLPWVAEADLLLSDLCYPVGYEQYAMDTAVRAYLMDEMEQVLGEEQLKLVAKLLLKYVQHLEIENPHRSRQDLQDQQLAAMIYIDDMQREKVARHLAEAYQLASGIGESNGLQAAAKSEMARLSSFTQELAPKLQAYPQLLAYARVVGKLLADPKKVAVNQVSASYSVMEGVELTVPSPLLPTPQVKPVDSFEGFPPLEVFEFIDARFDDGTAEISFPPALETEEFLILTLETDDAPFDEDAAGEAYEQQRARILAAWIEEWGDVPEEGDTVLLLPPETKQPQEVLISRPVTSWDSSTFWVVQGDNTVEKPADIRDLRPLSYLETLEEEDEEEELESFDVTVVTLIGSGQRWQRQERRQTAYRFVEPLSAEVALEMVAVPSGRFMMGSPENEPERYRDESPQHGVTVESFFMGRYPVTQAQWRAVAAMKQVERELEAAPSEFKGDDRPVEQVSWQDAVEFCARLSVHTGREYRLPSEAEWEYACRAGTMTPFHFGDMITTEVANYNGSAYAEGPEGEYRQKTTPVKHFGIANAFGISDMHGNVWEWCQDKWHDNYDNAPMDGSAWEDIEGEEINRVVRGCSWSYDPGDCRSAIRYNYTPDDRFNSLGFRVVCSAPRILP